MATKRETHQGSVVPLCPGENPTKMIFDYATRMADGEGNVQDAETFSVQSAIGR
jgi:hypothetical protein